MLRIATGILLIVLPQTILANDFDFSWESDGETDIMFGGTDFVDALTKTGNLGGVLKDAEIMATAEASASASYKATGNGYSLGVEADLNTQGSVFIGNIGGIDTYESPSADIDVSANFQDVYRLVGQGTVPFNSTVLNLNLEGLFDSSTTATEFSQVRAKAFLKDRATGDSFLVAEYARGFGEEKGTNDVSAFLSISKLLGPNQNTIINAGLRATGFASGEASLKIGFGKTLTLESITFPDGSTPESHGFAIVFESGLVSPNLPSLVADFDMDGDVDGADLLRWEQGYGIVEDALGLQGNADSDEDVDGSDFLLWQQNFGSIATYVATSAAVPEPNTLLLATLASLVLTVRCRRSTEVDLNS